MQAHAQPNSTEAERRLRRRRGELLDRLDTIAHELAPEHDSDDPVGSVRTGGCPTLAAIIAMSQREISQIDRALARVRSGEYGHCARCHTTIRRDPDDPAPYRMHCEACGGPRASQRRLADDPGMGAFLRPVRDEVGRAVSEIVRERRTHLWPSDHVARATTALLCDFRLQLAQRFAHQCEGGPLLEAVDRVPRLAPRAEKLFGDHQRLLARVDRLVGEARRAGVSPSRWRNVRDELRDVSADLLAHQRDEDAICSSAGLADGRGG